MGRRKQGKEEAGWTQEELNFIIQFSDILSDEEMAAKLSVYCGRPITVWILRRARYKYTDVVKGKDWRRSEPEAERLGGI